MSKILLRPPKDAAEVSALAHLANADKHQIIHPSHLILKDGETAGYLSIFSAPIVLAWFSTKKCEARDSVRAIEAAEVFMRGMGRTHYLTTCDPVSPFFPVMERLGFKNMGATTFMHKDI